MGKLTEKERQALDNACARLRETRLGTKLGNVEDFLDIDVLSTDANTVSAAINELFEKWSNPLLNVQVPPPGFFTLAGDEDGNLWCFCNDESNPPLFEHDENTGNLYLYIADENGMNGYKVHVGNYIAVKHLNDYYTKTETDNKLSGKSNTGHNHDERYYTESEVNTKLGGKSDTGHTHDDRYYTETEMNTKLASKSDTTHTHDTRYYLKSEVDSIEDTLQSAINSLVGFTAEVVSSLPATGENGVMYLVLSESGANQDIYDEYISVNGGFEKIGNTSVSVDLSGYATVDFVNSALSAKSDTGHGHGMADITNLDTIIAAMNNNIRKKADGSHTHDDRYYTESEMNTKLASKSDTNHTHNKPHAPHPDSIYTNSFWEYPAGDEFAPFESSKNIVLMTFQFTYLGSIRLQLATDFPFRMGGSNGRIFARCGPFHPALYNYQEGYGGYQPWKEITTTNPNTKNFISGITNTLQNCLMYNYEFGGTINVPNSTVGNIVRIQNFDWNSSSRPNTSLYRQTFLRTGNWLIGVGSTTFSSDKGPYTLMYCDSTLDSSSSGIGNSKIVSYPLY